MTRQLGEGDLGRFDVVRGCVRNEVSIPQGAFEDLMLVPGDVDHVYGWLVRPGDEQGFAGEGVYGQAGLVSGYVEAGHADAAVLGDAEDA